MVNEFCVMIFIDCPFSCKAIQSSSSSDGNQTMYSIKNINWTHKIKLIVWNTLPMSIWE